MTVGETVCVRCGTTFVAQGSTARFCGDVCRRAAAADRRRLAREASFRGSAEEAHSPVETAVELPSVDDHAAVDNTSPQAAGADEVVMQPTPSSRGALAAVGGFVLIPPVMLSLGLLLVILGQLGAGVIEVAGAVAVFAGMYLWSSRHR